MFLKTKNKILSNMQEISTIGYRSLTQYAWTRAVLTKYILLNQLSFKSKSFPLLVKLLDQLISRLYWIAMGSQTVKFVLPSSSIYVFKHENPGLELQIQDSSNLINIIYIKRKLIIFEALPTFESYVFSLCNHPENKKLVGFSINFIPLIFSNHRNRLKN